MDIWLAPTATTVTTEISWMSVRAMLALNRVTLLSFSSTKRKNLNFCFFNLSSPRFFEKVLRC